jgi:hypothetical protein
MAILILVILNSSGSSITTNSINFSSESACLKAINKIIDMESRGITIKARCVKYEL